MTETLKTRRRLRKRKAFRRYLLLLALACSKSAGAQSTDSRSSSSLATGEAQALRPLGRNELRSSRQLFNPDRKKSESAEAFLRFESLQYPTSIPGKENLNQNNMIEAGLAGDTPAEWGRFIYEAEAGRSLNINYSYFAVQDFAYEYDAGAIEVAVGRKREFWSTGDQDWNLGLWQPLFSQDSLRLKAQGLTGLHLQARFPKFQAQLFYSPFVIPSMTPDLADRNGEITSESRWFSSVPKSTELIGKETQLYYRLNIPELRKLLSQENIAARVRVGDERKGAWASLALADKAQNSMYFKYDAALKSRESGSLGEIELRPVILRHQVASLDLGYQFDGGGVSLSYTEDRPVDWEVENEASRTSGRPTDFIQQRSEPLRVLTAHWEQRLKAPRMKMPIEARVDYIKATTSPTVDVDSSGVVRSSLFPGRLLFTNAISVEARSSLTSKSGLKLKYLRDFDQQGSLWSAELQYQTRSKWVAHLGADILGSDDPSEANTDARFLNAYRQNDRIYGGLSYVF